MHKTDEELDTILDDANRRVRGSADNPWVWRHAKTENAYRVLTVSLRESDLVPLVTYYSVANSLRNWTRTVDEFLEKFQEVT